MNPSRYKIGGMHRTPQKEVGEGGGGLRERNASG